MYILLFEGSVEERMSNERKQRGRSEGKGVGQQNVRLTITLSQQNLFPE